MADFNLNRERLQEVAERLAGMWEVTYYHRELRPKVKENTGGAEKTRVSSGRHLQYGIALFGVRCAGAVRNPRLF